MDAYICDGVRTPIGRYGGALSTIRTDDLAAIPIRALMERHSDLDWAQLDEVVLGDANQAGESNRNVARMALLLAGLPPTVPGVTVNRLCASGLDAVGIAARALRSGDQEMVLAGGVESMSRAPFVMPKPAQAFSRHNAVYDTTIGWRFVNPVMEERYGTDSMPQTGDNVAAEFDVSREDQDAFALRSQERWCRAQAAGLFRHEIVPVNVPQRRGPDIVVERDEHPRPDTGIEALSRLRPVNGPGNSVTAGNASGVNDGAAALLLAGDGAVKRHGLVPVARIKGMASAGVEPRIMGIGPVEATKKLLARLNLTIDAMDVIEFNEAFASQAIASLRLLGVAEDAAHVNANGGAIALGHPLGMSGARLALSAAFQLQRMDGRLALCTMCVGVGQGVAMILERV